MTKSGIRARWIDCIISAFLLLLVAEAAWAAPCDLKNNPPDFIRHNLSISYCELCGYGYVTTIISNPYEQADMTSMTVVENLLSSGLTYDPTAPSPVTYSVDGGPSMVGGAPAVSGANGSVLTWTSTQIPDLARLNYQPGNNSAGTITITFAVTRYSSLTQEGLISATRNIQAQLTYSAEDVSGAPPYSLCPGMPATVSTGLDTLALHEPDPDVFKRGRNVDANQGSWSQTVYGNVNDDVIWRIQVSNSGQADLQDLRLDDVMQTGNIDINYLCPSAAAAAAVANNNGIDPGGGGCVAAGNTISNLDVDNPFGNPGNDSPDLVDVPQGGSAYIYVVGKIPASSPNGSCSANRTNTVSDLQWGCQADSPAGGITATSTGSAPGTATATLSSLSNDLLNIQTEIIGANTSQPAGTKATVRITIRNNTGGTVKGIKLRDVLPTEYVVDPTYAPRVTATGAYGAYDGMTDSITWTNPAAGTFPLTTTDPAVALSNTAPEFTLYSSTTHPVYGDQFDMLRNGDRLVVEFRVVLIRPQSYDRVANLDVRTEDPNSTPAGTDPDNAIQLTNQLYVDFEDFCDPGTTKHPPTNPIVTTHQSDPEDLDVDIAGSELVFILTGDQTQRLPLTVNLTNNGGHDADDYVAYITFGRTMNVVTVPSGCVLGGNPPALDEWQLPAAIPADAAVYQCTGSPIAPGQTVALNFEVLKSQDTGDLAADDLTFRADVTGQITLSDGTPLWFPTPVNPRADNGVDPADNYSLDGIRARVIGFNLLKSQSGNCSENNPPPGSPDLQVQIGEECSYQIDTGGWFGFQTPGFTYIAVQRIQVVDELPDGQGYISSPDPALTSDSTILGISLNPGGLAPLDEGWIDWTFNQVVPGQRITVRDQWFQAFMTARLLNDPIDTSAAPNLHAAASTNTLSSYFQAVFYNDTTGMEEVYDLGPGTVGYPRVDVRRISLTVTEPQITVVKEVCNESLYGTGPACSNFVPLADDGDAFNSYIYRLTLTNEASSGGVTRAPAYDVTVTDTLDASDLAYVLPFASDGLDNDGDGSTSGTEGTISDNTVKNSTPAVITFSYTHSTALERIDPGASVQLYYRVDYDDDAAPLQTFTNTAGATYDSLEGASGNQSAPQQPNSDKGGARVYTSAADSATVQIIPVLTQPKRIAALSNTPLAGSGTQGVSIGEEIDYRLHVLLPVALLRNFVIRDELPAGIRCSEAPAVNLDAAPYAAANFVPGGTITPTCTDSVVEWNFGDQRVTTGTVGGRYDFGVGFIARVDNTAGTNDGNVISNGSPATNAFARYIDEGGSTVTENFNQVDVQVREPLIALTKAFSAASTDAGDILTVTVTATNNGTATAYNLRVLDDLAGSHMTFTGSVGGSNPPDSIDTATLGANRPIFSWNAPNGIDPGNSISFTFTVSVDTVTQPHEVLANTIQADWTSLPGQTTALNTSGAIGANGSTTGMRIGALPNAGDAINDYETTASDSTSVPAVTMTKTDLNSAVTPTIGVHKSFRIDIVLPEGTTNNVIATDNLNTTGLSYVLENNAGFDITYTFQGIASINGQAPGEAAFNAFPADGATGNIVWNIGTVVTQTENDQSAGAINPLIRIDYTARINNDADTDGGDTLRNGVTLNYTNGQTSGQETLTDATALLTVVEPSLSLAKFVANDTNPGNPPQAGDILRYTLTFTAAGGGSGDNFSDAFDLRIDDSLSLGLVYVGNPTVGGAGNTIGAPVLTGDGVTTAQTLRWSLADGNADIDIAEGTTVDVTYDVRVDNSVLIDQTLTNSATAQWTSLDGADSFERNGTATPAYNDYFTGPAATSVVVGGAGSNTVAKTRLLDTYGSGDANVRIGDIVEYELRLGMHEGATANAYAIDTLPQGLQFEGIVSINGDTSAPFTSMAPFVHSDIDGSNIVVAGNAATGPTTVTITLGTVINQADGNPANDDFVIVYRARVLNAVHPQVNTIDLTNTVAMGYDTASGPATTITDNETVTVLQPNLAVSKSAVAAGGDTVLAAGELVTYTVDIANSGPAPAYDTVLRDIIPAGMRNGAATITMVSTELLTGGALTNLAPAYDAATGIATWNFDTGTADQYTIPAGDTLRIVYQVQADAGLGPGMTLTNQAQVQLYYSFDDDAVPTRGTVAGVREVYGPSNTATTTFTTDAAGSLTKANPADLSAAIGQPFSYRITVPDSPQATTLHDVRILDDLSASAADLTFIRVTKISGSQPWTPVNTGTATNLVIEDTTTGIEIPAGEQIVIDITVMLADTGTNTSGTTFFNTASYTYNGVDNDPATQATGGTDATGNMTIVGPDDLTLEKSGPATMQVGTPETFTLNVHNTGTGTAWNLTILDRLPNETYGGTCGTGPTGVTAQIFAADGTTPVSGVLVEGSDYTVQFNGAPTCEWTLNLSSDSGGLPAGRRLIVNYNLQLDPVTQNGVSLTNVAGATRWYSYDPNAADAAPRIYTRVVDTGTPTILDHEDAHTVDAVAAVLQFTKRVRNATTGQDPGTDASPGDTLHYTLEISNSGPVGLSDFSISDDLDALNSVPVFAPGTLSMPAMPSAVDPVGGIHNTGMLNISGLTIGPQGGGNDTLTLEFDITLAPVIASGTVARNQAALSVGGSTLLLSDDPNLSGAADPTETTITSAPVWQVRKTSAYISGDPSVLLAGETLRYTITINNIGNENAVNVSLRDSTPANTTYVANSTTLNGAAVADPGPGVNPLITGIAINAAGNATPGFMPADSSAAAANTATVTFDVVVDPAAMDGLVLENQAFVSSAGEGSGARPDQPSDDPGTPVPDDPTLDVVGNVPLLYAHKTVAISQDFGTAGIVDPDDVLMYTITISNTAAIPATGVVLTDAVPNDTAYVANSLRLNGAALAPDGGVSPLIAGLSVQSADNPGAGIISAGQSAVVTFEVRVNTLTPTGRIISNQGTLASSELPTQLTDADGLPGNGFQPTIIVVGDAQLLAVSKSVAVVGGGAALAGGQLEYTIRVTNPGTLAATNVTITDDLGPPLDTQVAYVAGSGTLNGAATGVTFAGDQLTADYAGVYGDLPAGASAVVRFRVQINAGLAIGTTITNTGVAHWNSPSQNTPASVSIDVGGTPGSGMLNGNVWHDANLDHVLDSTETHLQDWTVALYRNSQLVSTATTDAGGAYQFAGLVPSQSTSDQFELRFTARGAGANAAALGYADSVFTNGPHRISNIVVSSGSNLQNLNLPIQPNGTVYNSVLRVAVSGARLAMLNAATRAPVSSQCFDDPNQQNQVTAADGFYKFDMNFSDGSCPAGGAYLIQVTSPASGYRAAPSLIIPPTSDATTAPFSVPACPGSANDAVPTPPGYCEVVATAAVPPLSVQPRTPGTTYHLHLLLGNGSVPGQSQIFNNPIPIDPVMDGAAAITKTTSMLNVTRSSLVPYTITVTNVLGVPLYDVRILDRFPAGFKYVAGSARLNGDATEPQINGRELAWSGLDLQTDGKITIELLLVVGSGVTEDEYVNRALVYNSALNAAISGEATATVRVIPDPDFDCTDVIGKVFDDANMNGIQNEGEKGLTGVRLVTARGLISTTDQYGRFHITCAAIPDEDRGSNFILKLDERSLPSGYRVTTENPRVLRATRGKMLRFNFGAAILRVVRMDIADGVFEPDTSTMRMQWEPRIGALIGELQKAPSVLRLSYLADLESRSLVNKRLGALKKMIARRWEKAGSGYALTIETEVFWRRGESFGKR